jgi:phage repressor protein C with HTH and peptisase S24 domain
MQPTSGIFSYLQRRGFLSDFRYSESQGVRAQRAPRPARNRPAGDLMRHDDIWRALDTLAAEKGLSPSGLARRAGLDPTTFNPSKRVMPDGRARWPSTESLAKALDATGNSLAEFAELVGGARALSAGRPVTRRVPLIGFAQAGSDGFFDDGGYPVGGGWDEVSLPEVADQNAYALEISGDSMEPVFRDGDMVIVSPAAPIRRGDRVVVRTQRGEVMAKQLVRRSARRIELRSLNPEHPDYSFDLLEVAFMHRIIWASQ